MHRKRMTFEDWCKAVNTYLVKKCGLGRDDLPDIDYWMSWDTGHTPQQGAEEALEYAGFSFMVPHD